jgi:hypothetical protein
MSNGQLKTISDQLSIGNDQWPFNKRMQNNKRINGQ